MTPYIAVASQKITLTRFLERIRGAFTEAPTSEEPVNQIPHAAPITEKPKPIAIPQLAQLYGDSEVITSFQPSLHRKVEHFPATLELMIETMKYKEFGACTQKRQNNTSGMSVGYYS